MNTLFLAAVERQDSVNDGVACRHILWFQHMDINAYGQEHQAYFRIDDLKVMVRTLTLVLRIHAYIH